MRRRRRRYLVMMGICLALYVLSWAVIVRFSTTAAVITSLVALAIPPFAVVVGNRSDGG